MRSTETLAAPTALAPRWRTWGEDGDLPDLPEQPDGDSDSADWHEASSDVGDPYGQQFRPHLFGI